MKTRMFLAAFLLFFCLINDISAQKADSDIPIARARAMLLVDENRYLDAYPLLERVASSLPDDVEVWTHYGIAIAARSATLSDAGERKSERKRSYVALSKAKDLGTRNVMALHFLDEMSPDGGGEDNFGASNPEVEKALREGEAFFGRGEYQKAFIAYERAYKLDPKSYEASLFLGDTFYAQKKYAESERWFAKAVAIDQDRETAHRFWGDALLYQGKLKEAGARFIEAFVAEPYSRYAWENINKLTEKYGKQFNVKGIFPPGTEAFEGIKIDTAKLSSQDGSAHWLKYTETRDAWRREMLKKVPEPYRHSLKEEAAALRAVAAAAAKTIKSGEVKNPHHSLINLIELNEKDMIEPYVLLLIANEQIAEDYFEYRKTNRDKLRKFLTDLVFVF